MKKGFTLIEIMIVIVILGILATFVSGNYITSLKKGRDARRKTDLQQIQNALELYYEDQGFYPTFDIFPTPLLKLCQTRIGSTCPTGEKVYMQKIPDDPIAGNKYYYQTDANGSLYLVLSCLENPLEQSFAYSQNGYTNTDCGSCGECKFGNTSTNISLSDYATSTPTPTPTTQAPTATPTPTTPSGPPPADPFL